MKCSSELSQRIGIIIQQRGPLEIPGGYAPGFQPAHTLSLSLHAHRETPETIQNSSEAPFTAFKPHWRASLPVSACVSSSLSLSPHLSTRRGAGAVPWQCRPSDMADALPAAANFSSKPRDRSRRARAWLNHARRCWFAGPGVWHRRGAEGASGFGCRKGLVSVVW